MFLWNFGGFLPIVASFGSGVWLLLTPPSQVKKNLSLLIASALFHGASIGSVIALAIEIDPSLILSAFVGASLVFALFSDAALVAKRRKYLYLSGLVSSSLSIILWLHIASSVFGDSTAFFEFRSCFGLLVFVCLVLVDTQKIIEKAHLGDLHHAKHALGLFISLAGIFMGILIKMMENSAQNNEE